jgi:hypothetical protein
MPMWRCPHCGTPQPEAARCWVCRRSSTTCSTCRHFRRSLAASVGFCGLDRRRLPLRGDEHRGCWDPAAATQAVLALPAPRAAEVGDRAAAERNAVSRLRGGGARAGLIEGFVPIEQANLGPRTLEPADHLPAVRPPGAETVEGWADRETLFGEG